MRKSTRRFISLLLLTSAVLLAVSGLGMYLRPEGSIAEWVGWTFLGLSKTGWEHLHTGASILFLACAVLHGLNNLRPLLYYLKRKSIAGISVEAIAAVSVTIVVGLAAVAGWQPLSLVASGRASIKDGALCATCLPPVENAAELSLSEFSKASNVELDRMISVIQDRSSTLVDTAMTFGAAARICGLSPDGLFQAVTAP